MFKHLICFALVLFWIPVAFGNPESAILDVRTSQEYFSPAAGEKVEVSFRSACDGETTVQVLDRDTHVASVLADGISVKKGGQRFSWDGKGPNGRAVPDEAWSFRIVLKCGGTVHEYFPAKQKPAPLSVEKIAYSRQTGLITYTLPAAARVHAQAGIVVIDKESSKPTGPVLKTIVPHLPRSKGPIVEAWTSHDESGTIYLPSLPNFSIAVFATSLPDGAVLTTGNQAENFLSYALERKSNPLLEAGIKGHHHQGLTSLEDISPELKIAPKHLVWDEEKRFWRTDLSTASAKVSYRLDGRNVSHFVKLGGSLSVYIDEKFKQEIASPKPEGELEISTEDISPGPHIVALNWATGYGPATVNSFLLFVEKKQ